MRDYESMCQVDWRSGHVSGAVYGAVNEDLCNVAGEVYCQHMWANPLHPDLFPNIRKMEAEVSEKDWYPDSSDSVEKFADVWYFENCLLY